MMRRSDATSESLRDTGSRAQRPSGLHWPIPPTAIRPAKGHDIRGICSWSGGKDSALALQCAIDSGVTPVALLTMFG